MAEKLVNISKSRQNVRVKSSQKVLKFFDKKKVLFKILLKALFKS